MEGKERQINTKENNHSRKKVIRRKRASPSTIQDSSGLTFDGFQ